VEIRSNSIHNLPICVLVLIGFDFNAVEFGEDVGVDGVLHDLHEVALIVRPNVLEGLHHVYYDLIRIFQLVVRVAIDQKIVNFG